MLTYEVYSNWLFIWFIFHYLGYISASPLIFFIIALNIVIINGLTIINFNIHINTLGRILYNLTIKIVPILMIFKLPIFNEEDLLFGFILLYTYVITLLYLNKNPIDIYLNVRKKYIINYDK